MLSAPYLWWPFTEAIPCRPGAALTRPCKGPRTALGTVSVQGMMARLLLRPQASQLPALQPHLLQGERNVR